MAEEGVEELIVEARRLMDTLADVVKVTLMIVDAERDGDDVSIEMLKHYTTAHGFGGLQKGDWIDMIVWDSRTVFGKETEEATSKAHL